ncbi:MAG: transglycosylase SLT domain-containing protein [Alphaproteobacteria bacterium]|nr:transglycosylase SLT domain-containing protein [Alphaproteobacteria bacterium]
MPFLIALFVLFIVPLQAQAGNATELWIQVVKNNRAQNFSTLENFLLQYSDWPQASRLLKMAEETMPSNYPDQKVLRLYRDLQPQTTRGVTAYTRVLTEQGEAGKAQAVLKDFWEKKTLSTDDQAEAFQRFRKNLSGDNHQRRVDMLLYSGQYTSARALARMLGQGFPQLVEARITMAENKAGAEGAIARVPAALQSDAGLLFERLRYRRVRDLNSGMQEILARQPSIQRIANPESWWRERHILVRRMMERRNFGEAYKLAAAHGQAEGAPFADAEWLAGWLSLRFLDKPERAAGHFEKMYKAVTTPVSKSRGAYWLGRALEAMGRKDEAVQWYENAFQYPTTFYGQRAAERLNRSKLPWKWADGGDTSGARAQIKGEPRYIAAQILKSRGMTREAAMFIDSLAENIISPAGYAALGKMAVELGVQYEGVVIAKEAARKNIFLREVGYPTRTAAKTVRSVDPAMVHALIRQESQFDSRALSSAGARGLMQLMPATAQETAKKHGIGHRKEWLTDRPEHNIRLGTLYFKGLLDRYDNAYPLAVAAYNAGPGNVNKWLKLFGDPRTKQIHWLDWVELIPISETRNYVQRVLENQRIYQDEAL